MRPSDYVALGVLAFLLGDFGLVVLDHQRSVEWR